MIKKFSSHFATFNHSATDWKTLKRQQILVNDWIGKPRPQARPNHLWKKYYGIPYLWTNSRSPVFQKRNFHPRNMAFAQ